MEYQLASDIYFHEYDNDRNSILNIFQDFWSLKFIIT